MSKYFVALLPPKAILNEIVEFQKKIEKDFGSVHAQKAPPHITIIPPFECNEEVLNAFSKELSSFLNNRSPTDLGIHLDNFQRFESRTLFVDVAKNGHFEGFCKELKLFFNQQKIIKQRIEKHYFVPHITIANKDIKKRDFKTAWENFKPQTYQRNFNPETLSVLELIDENWEIKTILNFKK